jgi:hypothetical protein
MSNTSSFKEEKEVVDSVVQKNMALVGGSLVEYLAETTPATKKKKKILREVSASEVRQVMNYKPDPYKVDIPDDLIRCFPEMAAAIYIMAAETAPVAESLDQWMLERREDYARQLKAKGIVTREVEVDEDYDEEKDNAPLHRGRRRHRPGVMKKHQGGTDCSFSDFI